MSQALLLRFHRWIALAFAIPLSVIIVTGLLQSLLPLMQAAAIKPGTVTIEKVEGWLDKYDPQNQTRAVALDTYYNYFTLDGPGPDGTIYVDTRTGAESTEESAISNLIWSSRGIHEHLIFDLGWLVTLSTAAMLVIITIGTFMGLPRLSNSMSGWHKATAWFLLPLLFLSALSGLLMSFGITISSPAPRAQPLPIRDALRMVVQKHDLSGLDWIRLRGGRQLARISDGFNQRTYLVTAEGLKPAPSNLPRTFHEGTFFGIWGGVMNVILSFAFALLLGTGVLIWARRTFRRRQRVRRRETMGVPAE
jgi:uncharacterized iron-regulated membrane protein